MSPFLALAILFLFWVQGIALAAASCAGHSGVLAPKASVTSSAQSTQSFHDHALHSEGHAAEHESHGVHTMAHGDCGDGCQCQTTCQSKSPILTRQQALPAPASQVWVPARTTC